MSDALAQLREEEANRLRALEDFKTEQLSLANAAVEEFNRIALAIARDEPVPHVEIAAALETTGRPLAELETVTGVMRRAIQLSATIRGKGHLSDDLSTLDKRIQEATQRRKQEVKALEDKHSREQVKEVSERTHLVGELEKINKAQKELDNIRFNLLASSEMERLEELREARFQVLRDFSAGFSSDAATYKRDRELDRIDAEVKFLEGFSHQRLEEVTRGEPGVSEDGERSVPIK